MGEPVSMIGNRELWQCAGEVLKQHGGRAPRFVAERIGALALAGDTKGVTIWKGIARRIDALQSGERNEPPMFREN